MLEALVYIVSKALLLYINGTKWYTIMIGCCYVTSTYHMTIYLEHLQCLSMIRIESCQDTGFSIRSLITFPLVILTDQIWFDQSIA